MKYITLIALVALFFGQQASLQSQSMRWVPMKSVQAECGVDEASKNGWSCYALEYLPATSGILTSYTTGFLLSCTSFGPSVVRNLACNMNPNVRLINQCDGHNLSLMNCSGNGGSAGKNTIQAGVPVILHTVCFDIPVGESITITEEEFLDLTTSITAAGNSAVTEFPEYETITIRRQRPDDAVHSHDLAFRGEEVGEGLVRLDWELLASSSPTHFVVERSQDDKVFSPIGKVQFVPGMTNYSFVDKEAFEGNSFYRIQLEYQDNPPIRSKSIQMNFNLSGMQFSATPNPANEFLSVKVSKNTQEGMVQLISSTGVIVESRTVGTGDSILQLDVSHLTPGVYTLKLKSNTSVKTQSVLITR